MATLTMTPTRQPLGCLDMPLMRSKLNRQNQQNGTMSMKSTPMKTSIFIDSENINPSFSTKRKRSFEDDEDSASKPIKTSRMALSTRINISPRLSTPSKISITTPKSAPILKPAGRSPPPKSSKSATRRSLIAKPRSDQYTKRGVARPFSLASALAQSTTPKPKPAPKAPTPASWCFDIHVDTEQEEMTNLMQHSTTVLDISDDEGKSDPPCTRGKENIPPHELGIELPTARQSTTTIPAAARKAPKMDEPRAPLGELNAAEYYAEGCNAFSYTIVYDDEPEFKKPSSPLARSQESPVTASIASVLDAVASRAETQHQDSTDSTESAL
ncbi:hypothetical protein N7517_008788 [Penicillium concentricum]|uniref:Uncharacterized protein n=1 Tax=Penicillium concentricum TaxID=293559 RepID=A0A9W9RT01_9EURO|nr:uncharacterized protein N7517_008788 [Penicillium concentricum]KAJ5365902.1 hypothetical protein N7517_008788 [Penicillium concentricum]